MNIIFDFTNVLFALINKPNCITHLLSNWTHVISFCAGTTTATLGVNLTR